MFIDDLTALTNYDIVGVVKELKIKDFRGIFTSDTLPNKINDNECGILNLDYCTQKHLLDHKCDFLYSKKSNSKTHNK